MSGGLDLKRRESVEVSNRENVNPASSAATTSNEKASSSSLIIRNIRTRGHTRSLVPTIPEEVRQESFDINPPPRPQCLAPERVSVSYQSNQSKYFEQLKSHLILSS